jgi:hypothetical protein
VGQVPWRGREWIKQDESRDAIARLAAEVTTDDPEDQGKKIRVDFMSHKNPVGRAGSS